MRDAHWVLPEPELARIEEIGALLVPSDAVEREVWLFDSHAPKLPGGLCDPSEYQPRLRAERRRALRAVHGQLGDGGVLRLADRAEQPGLVAWAIPDALDIDGAERLLDLTRFGDERARLVAGVLSAGAEHAFGMAWRGRLLGRARDERWPLDVVANSLGRWPDEPATWDAAASFGEAANRAYWSAKLARPLHDRPAEDLLRASTEYLAAGRALDAIEAVGPGASGLPGAVLIRVLRQGHVELSRAPAGTLNAMLRYDIGLTFQALRDAPDADRGAVARLEYHTCPCSTTTSGPVRWCCTRSCRRAPNSSSRC